MLWEYKPKASASTVFFDFSQTFIRFHGKTGNVLHFFSKTARKRHAYDFDYQNVNSPCPCHYFRSDVML